MGVAVGVLVDNGVAVGGTGVAVFVGNGVQVGVTAGVGALVGSRMDGIGVRVGSGACASSTPEHPRRASASNSRNTL